MYKRILSFLKISLYRYTEKQNNSMIEFETMKKCTYWIFFNFVYRSFVINDSVSICMLYFNILPTDSDFFEKEYTKKII